MPNLPSSIRSRLVDAALAQDAGYVFNANDRAYVDDQIRGCQQHLVDSLIAGIHATWATVDGASPALSVGDVVTLAGGYNGVHTVTRAVLAALVLAGQAFGVVMVAGSPGGSVRIATSGAIPPAVTGLTGGGALPFVRVNTTTGRCEAVASLLATDYSLGSQDSGGFLILTKTHTPTLAATSITHLRTLNSALGTAATMIGRGSAGDGGEGHFAWIAGTPPADNGGTLIVPASQTIPGYWKRVYSGPVDVKWFGAVGDGTTDNSAAFALILASGLSHIFFSPGTYSINTNTTFPVSMTLVFGVGAVLKPTMNPNGAIITINGPIVAGDTQQIFAGVSQTWQVTQSGAGPVVNLDRYSYGMWSDNLRIKIVSGGDLWVGDTAPTFQYSLDGGTTYLPATPVAIPQAVNGAFTIPTPFFYTIPGTGIRIMFPCWLYSWPVTLSENTTPVRLTVASTAGMPATTPHVAVSASVVNTIGGAFAVDTATLTGTTFLLTGSTPTGGAYPGYGGEVSVPCTYVTGTVYSWAKTSGAVTTSATSSNPSVTVTNPNTTGVCYGFQIRIIVGGLLGTAAVTFSFTLNNGFGWSPVYACPAAGVPFILPTTAMTVSFAAGTYGAGTTYGFTTLSPFLTLGHGKDGKVSPGWWGIDPTAAVDCTASIHAAIASCGHYEAVGGEGGAIQVLAVRTPHGKYLTTGIYLCDAYCHFEGAGPGSGWGGDAQDYISCGTQFYSTTNFPILTLTSNGYQLGLGRAAPIQSLRLEDFCVQGNNAAITVSSNAASKIHAATYTNPISVSMDSTAALGIQVGQVVSIAPAYVGIATGSNSNAIGSFTVASMNATALTLQGTMGNGTYIADSCHISPNGWQHGIVLDTEAGIIAKSVHVANVGGYGLYIAECVGGRFYDTYAEAAQLDCIAMDNAVAPPLCKSISTFPVPRGITCNWFFGGQANASAIGSGIALYGGADGCLFQGFIAQSNAQYSINVGYDFNQLKRPVTGLNAVGNRFETIWDEANQLGGWIFGPIAKFNQINWSQNSDPDKGPNAFSDGSTQGGGASNQVTGAYVGGGQNNACNQTQIATLVRQRVARSIVGAYVLSFNPYPSWAECTLSGAVTAFSFNRTGLQDGQILDVMLVQPMSAAVAPFPPYALTWAPEASSDIAFIGGVPPVLTQSCGARDKHTFYYDRGVDTFFETSRSQNIHGFDMMSMSGCTWWLRADRGVTFSSGTNVNLWTDQSASGFNATGVAAHYPTFTASDAAFSNQPSITFDGSASYLNVGANEVFGHLPTTATLVIICKMLASTGNRTVVGRYYNFDSWRFGGYDGSGKVQWWAENSGITPAASVASAVGASHCFVGTYTSGTATTLYVDGSAQTAGAVATGAIQNSTDLTTIGCSADAAADLAYFANVAIVEIAAFSRVLTAAEIATVRLYSKNRYGTT